MHAVDAGSQLDWEGEKLDKSVLTWRKNTLIAVISGLNFSFKTQLLTVFWRKSEEFFPMAPFFFVLYMIAYQSVPNPKKTPLT